MSRARLGVLWLAAILLVLVGEACRGGAAARAAALPQPQDLGQWLAIAVFVLGVWWIALKILRG
jgi:hypothetical protein